MITFYIIGAVISWILMAGWTNAELIGKYGTLSWRSHLGFSLSWGLLAAPLWPIMLIMAFFMTGFAEHGWNLKTGK